MVSRVRGFFAEAVTDGAKQLFDLFTLCRLDLQADQHTAVRRAVVAVMEHGDIPTLAQLVEKAGFCMGRKPDAIGIITVMFVLGTLFTAAVQAMGAG